MFDSLLRIKAFREDKAAGQVTGHKRAVEERSRALVQAREAATRFHAFRIEREQQLFEEIRGRTVGLKAIDDMKRKVAGLREQEAVKAREVETAEQVLIEAKQALEQARAHHQEAVREHEKFIQLTGILHEEELRTQAIREENELEEVVSSTHRGAEIGGWS